MIQHQYITCIQHADILYALAVATSCNITLVLEKNHELTNTQLFAVYNESSFQILLNLAF